MGAMSYTDLIKKKKADEARINGIAGAIKIGSSPEQKKANESSNVPVRYQNPAKDSPGYGSQNEGKNIKPATTITLGVGKKKYEVKVSAWESKTNQAKAEFIQKSKEDIRNHLRTQGVNEHVPKLAMPNDAVDYQGDLGTDLSTGQNLLDLGTKQAKASYAPPKEVAGALRSGADKIRVLGDKERPGLLREKGVEQSDGMILDFLNPEKMVSGILNLPSSVLSSAADVADPEAGFNQTAMGAANLALTAAGAKAGVNKLKAKFTPSVVKSATVPKAEVLTVKPADLPVSPDFTPSVVKAKKPVVATEPKVELMPTTDAGSTTGKKLYHGTTSDFNEFKNGPNRSQEQLSGLGVHFYENAEPAQRYAFDPDVARPGKSPRVIEKNVDLGKVFDSKKLVYEGDPEWKYVEIALGKNHRYMTDGGKKTIWLQNALDGAKNKSKLREALANDGFDSISYDATVGRKDVGGIRGAQTHPAYIVFDEGRANGIPTTQKPLTPPKTPENATSGQIGSTENPFTPSVVKAKGTQPMPEGSSVSIAGREKLRGTFVESLEKTSDKRTWKQATQVAKDSGYDKPEWFDTKIENLKVKNTPLNDSEAIAFGKHLDDMENAAKELDKKILDKATTPEELTALTNRRKALQDKFETVDELLQLNGAEAGRTLAARAAFVRNDFSTTRLLAREKASLKRDLTPQEELKVMKTAEKDAQNVAHEEAVTELHAKIKELEEQVNKPGYDLQDRLNTPEAQAQENLTKAAGTRSARRTEFKAQKAELGQSIKDKWKNYKSETDNVAMSTVPGGKQVADFTGKLIEVAPDIIKLAGVLAKEGAATMKDAIKGIREHTGLTEEDLSDSDIHKIVAGHYTEKAIAKEQSNIAKLRKEAQELAGKPGLKTVEEKIATAQKRIDDLNANGVPESTPRVVPSELKAKLSEYQKLLREKKLEADEASGALAKKKAQMEARKQEKRINDAKDAIDEYEYALKSGNLTQIEAARLAAKMKKASQSVSDELLDVQMRKTELRREYNSRLEEKHTPIIDKVIREGFGIPRFLTLGLDAGALLRQGKDAMLFPKEYLGAAYQGIKALSKKKAFERENWLFEQPSTKKFIRDGGAIGREGTLTGTEEAFVSKAMKHIPGYAPSQRFHHVFLNELRTGLYNNLSEIGGMTPEMTKEATRFINAMTGRGDLFGNGGKLGNVVFTAPKLYAGQLQMMSLIASPLKVAKNPALRRLVARRTMGTYATFATMAGLAKLNGAEFSINPEDSDFLKYRKDGVVLDFGGGYTPYYRIVMHTINSLASSNRKNMVKDLPDKTWQQIRYKLSPGVQIPINAISGSDAVGQPFMRDKKGNFNNNWKQAAGSLAPIIARDVYELTQDPTAKNVSTTTKVIAGLSAIGGGGVQVYPNAPKPKDADGTAVGQLLKRIGNPGYIGTQQATQSKPKETKTSPKRTTRSTRGSRKART